MSNLPGEKDIRVLLAEDDYLVVQMIKGILQERGYAIVGEAADGSEVVELTQALQPQVVLMDIQMPDMDGLEATRLIYECCPTPVVVLTAYETPELVQRASRVGVGAYLVKPPNSRELERAITIAMARFDDMVTLRRLNAELQAYAAEREKLINELQEALANIKTLTGLLPICASCKKIRDDQGYWNQIESYIEEHSEVQFSHGLCPDCTRLLYPDFFEPR